MASHETLDLSPAASSKKKKKHSKKRKAIEVTVDASFPGAAAPVVGYFPTGYDPLAAADPPRARLFRHEKHHNRVELVVDAPGGGPDFVGRSYAGEAAAPQLCGYALGVLDKATGTLKIVPIASNKILRLEPHFEVQQPAHSQQSAAEACSSVADTELNRQDLTQAYGTKKDKDKDNKWKSLKEQRNDPSAYLDLDLGESKTADATDSQASMEVRNIPPYDPAADTSEKAYLFDEIIPKNIRPHLLDIVGHFESGEFGLKGYGSFVSNRVNKLHELQGEDQERLAWILSYITHLLSLLARNSSMSKQKRKEKDQTIRGPMIPQAVHRKLLLMFTEPGSSSLSTEKYELLINYILVLTLFADDFRSEPTDICADLKMNRQMLKPYYDQLGCKSVSTGAFKPFFMTLPAPLKFPQQVTRRRRRK
ncbi:DNA-directed RNA polymerase I subunit rpa49 [Hordeum vulgare subsp. vulgare]|uniref:DNA-directed RNA polymerase I subunit rpa49 n=3 Tax=Hordeum vulgare subsp. vulgare TaxID=112509 RepID=A0A287NRW6_HORVV|nr:DNA-directed RNA polymerase I subunit rpa49 [Hordeum vulgare subsp. vulgare]